MPAETSLMNVDELAGYIRMKRSWIYAQVRAGRIPHIRLGPKRVFFRKEAIDEWLSSRETVSRA